VNIVWQSFEGQYSDNPRVLFERWRAERPGDDHLWLADSRHRFPDDVETVPIYGPACVAALESADLVVANTHTDVEWRKRPAALYLQTWHGTPLKRIHHDVRWAPAGRLARLSADVARWDVLLSPNAVSTPRLRRAFRFDGEIAETGYPRNDLLNSPAAPAIRAQARRRLGIPNGVRAVLYTPTWRDDAVFAAEATPIAAAAELPALLDSLADDVVLLFRVHSLDGARHVPLDHPRLRDVSAHDDVAELYLAADAMITDYSSTMFDFAGTGKPILFYVPDYERFRDEVRGFYFDLADEAPGPLVRTPAALVTALHGLDDVRADFAGRYSRFRTRYCALEDGAATDRVLALIDDWASAGGTEGGALAGVAQSQP
jgi:CDP-glycerol glycerophosphotransferase